MNADVTWLSHEEYPEEDCFVEIFDETRMEALWIARERRFVDLDGTDIQLTTDYKWRRKFHLDVEKVRLISSAEIELLVSAVDALLQDATISNSDLPIRGVTLRHLYDLREASRYVKRVYS